jgi:hypothetical protein
MSQPEAHRHRQKTLTLNPLASSHIDAAAHHRASAAQGCGSPTQSWEDCETQASRAYLPPSPQEKKNHMAWHARVGPLLTLPHQIVGLDPSL